MTLKIGLIGVILLIAVHFKAQQELSVESINFWKPVADTFSYFNHQDSLLASYSIPQSFKKPSTWLEAQKEYRFYSSNDTLGFSLGSVLEIIDTEKAFWKVCAAKTWCYAHPLEVFPHLICRLSNKTKIGLVNTADLIVWDRIQTGELIFYGHGGGMQEDIFTIAGRASWILNWMTGENFSSVGIELTPALAREYQAAWVRYIQTNSK
ncbi:MAG: hypothetical protein RIQ90_1736 [Bacteroidota bacterium]